MMTVMNKNPVVFNIQRFSVNDGPGIRTTVFLKGCPLSCIWCHNPESQSILPQIMYKEEKCTSCGKCVSVCKANAHIINQNKHLFLPENCTNCMECTNVCFLAIEGVGNKTSSYEIITQALKDIEYYKNSGGGITLSGGEPLIHPDFCLEILKLAKENGLHTCIETCGYTDWNNILKISNYCDLFLYDIKLTDTNLHKKYTGVHNELIIENLKKLDAIGKKIILRCPIIPTINDTEEHFTKIAEIANSLKNVTEINILPYHSFGKTKYKNLGKEYSLESLDNPPKEQTAQWMKKLKEYTSIEVCEA